MLPLGWETDCEEYLCTFQGGCSWYCGGGPYNITSSSELDSTQTTNYKGDNTHDFDLKTAWVEGKDDYGIGESVSYHFQWHSPPVTTFIIYNGYLKNDKIWRANSRVKTLKILLNGKHYANLHLKDTHIAQIFSVGEELKSKIENKDMVITFEIAEVYPGEKYKDGAISEIELDGTGVH